MNAVSRFSSGPRAIFGGVRGRLLGSYVVLVLGLLFGMSAAFSSMQVLRTHFIHTVNTLDAVASTVSQIENVRHEEETSLRGYLLTGDAMFARRYEAAARTLSSLTAHADVLMAGDAWGRALLEAMGTDARAWEAWAAPYLGQSARLDRGS